MMMKDAILANKGKLIIACIVCIVAGAVAWGCMLGMGLLKTTGMGNIFNWGLLIAMFAFLVGFGAGSQFVASYIVISCKTSFQPFAIYAQAISLGGGIGAGVAILADLGAPAHIFSMILHPNPSSALTWDMIALTSFIIVSFVCLLACARQWRSLKAWMAIGAIVALCLQIVEGLLFSLISARVWWHSVIMPVDFVVVAVLCGLAAICLICAISRRRGAMEAARQFSVALFFVVIAHIVLSLIEIIVLSMERTAASGEVISLLGSYAPLYIVEIGLSLGAVIALRTHLDNATRKKVVICASLVIVAMFAHRMMLLYPAFGAATFFTELSNQASSMWMYPISTGFEAGAKETFALTQSYLPSFVEWISCLLPLGLASLIAIVGSNAAFYSIRRTAPRHCRYSPEA